MVTRSAAGLNARIAVASVLLALVVMGAFGLMVSTIQDLRASSRTALASEQVVATANRLEKLALDLETGQRGYALTGEEAFLAPFRRAAQQVPAVSRRLEQLVRHDPARLDRVRELEARITSYRRDWADPLIAAERRNPHAARHLLSTGRGKQRMDAIRARFSTFVGAEQQLAARHADRSDDGGRGAILIGLGAVGGSALLILVYATYLFRVVTIPVRRVAEGARRLAGGALSTRVPERGVGEVGALAGDFNAMADSLGRQSAQLQRQNAELEAVLDATIDGILMTDAEGTLLFSNKKIERFWSELGLPDEGTIWDRLVRLAQCTTTPDAYYDVFARIAADPRVEVEGAFQLRDSSRSFVAHTAPVGDSGGALAGRIFSIREVTAERQSEEAKDQFVATVSHELRTPLTSIVGFTELLLDPELDEVLPADERRAHLEVVQRNAARLQRLVGDLLFFAQVKSDKLALDVAAVDLVAIANGALDAARPLAVDKKIELRLESSGCVEVDGDGSRLEQLVDNLVSNAVKFTPEGGTIEVAVRADAGDALLAVTDTGIGIPADEVDRLFARFYRASTAISREIQGTGLGLAIARTIAEAHGGTIQVSSTPDRGTTFDVRLPLRRTASAPAASVAQLA